MKYLYVFFCLVFLSCNSTDNPLDQNGTFTTISYKVINSSNHKAKMRTVFMESGYFKFDDTVETNVFPYKKEYGAKIHTLANLGFDYEDKSTNNFSSYSITLQIFRNNVQIEEHEFFIDNPGEKIEYDFTIDK